MNIAPVNHSNNNKTSFKELIIEDEEYNLKNNGKVIKKILNNKQVSKLVKHYDLEGKNIMIDFATTTMADWVNFTLLDKHDTNYKEKLGFVRQSYIWTINANRMINKFNKKIKQDADKSRLAKVLGIKLREFNARVSAATNEAPFFTRLSRRIK